MARMPARRTVVFWLLMVGLTALGLTPIWATDLLPIVDSAPHLHMMRILHELDSDRLLQRYYVKTHAIVPYWTYYKTVDWLAYLMPLEQANRLLLAVCLAALPWSALALIRAAGHSRWLVLGVMPWMLNPDFFMGFFNFLMSIPLFLCLLATHLRLLQAPRWWRAALVAGLLCLLAATHYLLWAIALGLLPLLALLIGTRSGWRRALLWPVRDVLLVLPSIGVLTPWFLRYFVYPQGKATADQVATVQSGGLIKRLSEVFAGVHLGPIDNLVQLFDHLFDTIDPPAAAANLWERPGEFLSALWLAGLALWAVGAARKVAEPLPGTAVATSADRGPDDAATAREQASSARPWGDAYTSLAFVLILAVYFVMPQHLRKPIWLWGVNFRLTEVLAVLAVVALPIHPLRPPVGVRGRVWLGTALMAVTALLLPVATSRAFASARAEYGQIREAMAAIPPGKYVLVLRHHVTCKSLKYTIFNGLTEWYAVMRGGYVPYSFADTSSKPIMQTAEPPLPAPPWDAQEYFSWSAHGQYYDYVVVFREVAGKRDSFEEALPPEAVLVYGDPLWRVYNNPRPQRQ